MATMQGGNAVQSLGMFATKGDGVVQQLGVQLAEMRRRRKMKQPGADGANQVFGSAAQDLWGSGLTQAMTGSY